MRLIEVIAHEGHTDTLTGIAEQCGAEDVWWGAPAEDGRRSCRMLVADTERQAVMDALQHALGTSDNTRIIVQGVNSTLPRGRDASTAATREELYAEVARGARLDSNFLLLVLLSTVVVAVGLLEDNVAVVIGAMVIAPLLGPNIALAFATALGDRSLIGQAVRTNLAGVGLALSLGLLLGAIGGVDLASGELKARTQISLADIALALASGAAAVLSLTTGVSSTLVGVMVAVALLPPTATLGLLLGAGHWNLASGAALLLAANVVCVALAANVVFFAKGLRPRTWLERRRARQSWAVFVLFWLLMLAGTISLILLRVA